MADLIACIISELFFWREDYKFYKRKKARRAYEKEHNLPKKTLIHPVTKVFILFLIVGLVIKVTSTFIISSYFGNTKTENKIVEIETILEQEKQTLGMYPDLLLTIIRNNPLRKNITRDTWNNEFHYQQNENGNNYILISKGKDGILNTEDDINRTQ